MSAQHTPALSTATGCRYMRDGMTAIVSGFGHIECQMLDGHLAKQLVDRFNVHPKLVAALRNLVEQNEAGHINPHGMTAARAALTEAGEA